MNEMHIKNFDITIKRGELVSVIGPNGCGKTVFLKMILGRIKNDNIYIDGKNINELSLDYKKNNIVCVLNDNIFNKETVIEELSYYLNKLNLNKIEIENRVKLFIEYFSLESIINEKIVNLDIKNKVFIKILALLIIKPSLFCIDDLLTYLSFSNKNMILNYIKDNSIILLNVTSDMEELLLLDKILILNKGKKELFDTTLNVLCNEDMFSELGLSLPFIYDINNLLKSYDLIDSNHIVYKELVDVLWK